MTSVKLCRECKWSVDSQHYDLRCCNPLVNGADPWALSCKDSDYAGTNCRSEREKTWFAVCGRKGKQYVEKCVNGTRLYPHTHGMHTQPTGMGCDGS